MRQNRLQRPRDDDFPAMLAGARPQIYDPIGSANRLVVVLYHQHRISQIAHLLESMDQARRVALVQADTRLIQHIEHPGEARAYLRRQPDALRLAARKRARGAAQAQIIQPHIHEKGDAAVNFAQRPLSDGSIFAAEGARLQQHVDPPLKALYRPIADLVNGLARHGDGAGDLVQACAGAFLAGRAAHHLFDLGADVIGGGLIVAPLQVGQNAFVGMTAFPDAIGAFIADSNGV